MRIKKGHIHTQCGEPVWEMANGTMLCDFCGAVGLVVSQVSNQTKSEVTPAEDDKVKLTHRFYKGSDALSRHLKAFQNDKSILRETVDEAIEDAKNALTDNKGQDIAFVVEIIKVVKREKPPFIVKDVK